MLQKEELNGIKVRVFFVKNIRQKHLCHHGKNYYNFCKSTILVINLIVGFRNMIRPSQNMSFVKKIDKLQELFLPNTDNFLAFFIVF